MVSTIKEQKRQNKETLEQRKISIQEKRHSKSPEKSPRTNREKRLSSDENRHSLDGDSVLHVNK